MLEFLKSLAVSVVAIMMPVHSVIVAAMVLCLADMALGVWASRKRSEPITSKGLGRTLIKILVYESAVILGFIVETYLIGGLIPVTKLIGALIGLTEFKSVLENLDSIYGDNIFKAVIGKLGSKSAKKKPTGKKKK